MRPVAPWSMRGRRPVGYGCPGAHAAETCTTCVRCRAWRLLPLRMLFRRPVARPTAACSGATNQRSVPLQRRPVAAGMAYQAVDTAAGCGRIWRTRAAQVSSSSSNRSILVVWRQPVPSGCALPRILPLADQPRTIASLRGGQREAPGHWRSTREPPWTTSGIRRFAHTSGRSQTGRAGGSSIP